MSEKGVKKQKRKRGKNKKEWKESKKENREGTKKWKESVSLIETIFKEWIFHVRWFFKGS